MFGHGLSIIEVSDDGTGVPPSSRPMLATKYATSKITTFEDIYAGTGLTMGFRGEALFSMACLSKNLIVATRTDEEEMAQKLEFRRDGSLDMASVKSIHRKVGTTVAVVEPFSALPARRADMERRIRAERSKLYQLIQACKSLSFCCCCCCCLCVLKTIAALGCMTKYVGLVRTCLDAIFNVGIQLNLIDMVGSKEETALATSASSCTLEETVSAVLGHKLLTSLTRIHVDLKDVLKKKQAEEGSSGDGSVDDHDVCNWEISGLISKSPQAVGGGSGGRAVHYFCINGRVVQLPKIATMLRKIWNGYGGKKKPTCILTFSLPNNAFDINLSPDKQQVLLTHEQIVCELLQETVSKVWASQTEGVFQTQSIDMTQPIMTLQPMTKVSKQEQLQYRAQHEKIEEEDDDEEEENGERQMHKRRFGFVNDLTSCKMQHEMPSRRVSEGNEEKKHTEHEDKTSSALEEQEFEVEIEVPLEQRLNDEIEKGRPTKRAKVVSREELNIASSGQEEDCSSMTSNDIHSASRSLRRTTEAGDSISDLERRKWTEIQSKFNSKSRDTNFELSRMNQSPISPVTPDDVGSPKSYETASSALSSERRSSSRHTPMNQDENKNLTTTTEKLGLLQQFAYNPAYENRKKQKGTMRTGMSSRKKSPETVPSRSTDQETELDRHKRRLDEIRKGIPESQSNSRRSQRIANETDEAETQTTTIAEGEPAHTDEGSIGTKRQQKSKAVGDSAGADNTLPSDQREEGSPEEEEQEVIWSSFDSIQSVCAAARTQRLGMRWRKRELSEIERGRRSRQPEEEQVDEEAKDVAQSVGEGNSTEPTKSSFINISKNQFRTGMHVIGQFNMGFILARDTNNHLWILDQHAIDEKYNFEKLCRETVMHEQKLIMPMQLDLNPAEESCILDHLQIFEANGFRFKFNSEAPVRKRLSLTALPHSGAQDGRKAVQFGKEDVSALCSILSDGCSYDAGQGGTGTDGSGMYGNNAVRRYASTTTSGSQSLGGGGSDNANRIIARLPKAIAMFASRACRTSIMIGTSLSQKEMERLVRRLADVEHPWNCPHGRPTMRHVGEILPILRVDERRAAEHYTEPTVTVTPMTQQEDGEENRDG